MSSWRKKMRVKWNRNLDGGPSASNAIGGEDPPQLGLFERQGSLRKPSAPDKEEPFKRSWSFRIGGSGSKTKDASPGGNDKNAFLRMFRFGKDKKKGGHQEPGRRRMSDAAVTEAAARKEELSQWSSVPLDVSESPEAKRRQEAALVMRAHTLPRSLEAAPGGSECPDDAGGDVNAIWGLIYCDPRAEVNGDLTRPPRAKSPRNRESRSGKVFSDAVLPHFLSPGLDLSGGDAEQDEKRALKKLLLNGTCPAAEVLSENADGGHPVVNGAVVSGESEAVSADCGPPSADSVQADSGVASGAESCSEGKFVVANSDTERDEVPNAASEPCEHEISLSEQDGEPASNVTFVVEVNECYQDDCDQTEQAPCIENNREDTQPLTDTEDRSQVCTDSHDGASEMCPLESNVDANEQVANEDAEATDFERSCQRQRHDSASTGSNCEECPAQDEFEFVAAEPERPEQQRRMSRETVSPISDVSDDFPADEKASFIFLKPDRAGESFLSPLSTPDDELDGGPFGHRPLAAGDDCGTPGERYGNGLGSESDLESEDLNEPEEREVIIVDHLPSQESQDTPDVCVIGSDMIQSVNYETFVLENEVTLGTSGASSAQEAAQSGGTRASTARADSPPPANADGPAPRDAVEEEVPGANKLEASEGSFQDKLQYFNAISASPPKAASESKRPRTSRIPTASRLPRPSTAARPAKKESGIPVLTAVPVPAKRSRFGAKVGHIPQPSRNNACAPQQRQQVTPSVTRVTAAVAPNRDCSVAPKVPLFSGISKNAKHARHATAESNIAAAEEASKAQEAPGQLKRSGTFVLEESEQQPTDAVRSASLPRAAAEKDVVARETSSASPRPKQHHQQTTSGKDNVRVDSVQKRRAASPVAPVVVRDAAMKVASPCVSAASAPPSVQVPVVDSTDRALHSSDGDNDEDAACPCCNVKKGTAGATTRVNSQGPGTGPPSKIGEARIQAQTKAEFTKEIQRLGALCESRTKELTMLKLQLRHASAGFASFAVVVQHLNAQVLQNNSFRIPKLSEELRKSQEEIDKARIAIEEYKNKIEELKQSHEKEIIALREELEASHKKRTEELEAAHQNELTGYLEAHARKLEEMKTFYTDVVDSSRKSNDETLDAMKQRHREKIDAINEEYSLQLDSINEDHQARYKELEQRYEALQQQYKQLQQQAREFQESVLSDTDAKIQWLSKKNADLQKEVESLNVVLEMRANQIQNLQHAKIELERKEEELDRCKVKMQKMEARIEDLQELLNEKAKVQSQLSVENAKLRETSEKQNRQLSRLDMHNEELKYKLRESVTSPMRDGGNKTRARSTAHKRYSVADPTAMSQSWHAADHQSSPRASNGGGRLLSGAHGLHRINQTSHSLPRGSSEGFQPRMRRSMSETSPPQDACVQQLFASFAADVSGDGNTDESFSTFENSPCSQDDLLRLTWVKEDGDILQQDSETPNTPRVDSS